MPEVITFSRFNISPNYIFQTKLKREKKEDTASMKLIFQCLISIVSFMLAFSNPSVENLLLPKLFGNFTHSDLGSAPSCGTTMATYNSIPAKSNGQYQGTGTSCSSYGTYGNQYQCVEYTQR